jgi:hypothetical protein
MTSLALWQGTMLLAAVAVAAAVPMLASPAVAAAGLNRFPRHRIAGCALAAGVLLWSGWLVYTTPIEFLIPYRRWVPYATLVCIPLCWIAMPDLLSCRAIGGILALLPAPILKIARVHPSSWSLAITVLMYIMAVAGMWILLSPFRLRQAMAWTAAQPSRVRAAGVVSLALGLFLAALALTVLR